MSRRATTAPPIASPLDPIAFESEWMTTSAPRPSGRRSAGVATVESTSSGMPCSWASAARAGMSATASAGLDGTSAYRNLVSSSMLAAQEAVSSGSEIQRTPMPRSSAYRTKSMNVPP